MPNNLVLVTHADFAKGILTSLELILGQPLPDLRRERHGRPRPSPPSRG